MEYGNCFRFNSGRDRFGNQVPLRTVNSAGYDEGLTLEFFPGTIKNFISRLNNGINVYIGEKNVYPLYYEGSDCKTGQLSSIKISKSVYKKLPAPYSDCHDAKTFDSQLISEIKKLNRTYRNKDCLLMCYNKMVIKNCSCYDTYFQGILDASPCLSLEEISCVAEIYLHFLNIDATKTCIDLCPFDCEVLNYETKITYSKYPSLSHAYKLKNNSKIKKHFDTDNITNEMLVKNILSIRIYFDDLSYVVVTEYPKTQIIDIISSVGGLLGKFILG